MKTPIVAILLLSGLAGACWGQVEIQFSAPQAHEIFTFENGTPEGCSVILTPIELPPSFEGLVQTPKVLAELELVDQQREALSARIESLNKAFQRQGQGIGNKPDVATAKKLEELRRKYADDVRQAAEDVLLPFQQDRLQQIRLQAELRTRGSLGIESEAFADFLKLSDEQKEELKKKAAEMEEKLAQEIKELRQKRHREVLKDVLTQEQLKALEKHLGDPLADSGR